MSAPHGGDSARSCPHQQRFFPAAQAGARRSPGTHEVFDFLRSGIHVMSKKPEHPSVGLGVIIQRGERILLGLRKGWQEGSYSIPGGLLEMGETFEEGAFREVQEETGLELIEPRVIALINNLETCARTGKHHISVILYTDQFRSTRASASQSGHAVAAGSPPLLSAARSFLAWGTTPPRANRLLLGAIRPGRGYHSWRTTGRRAGLPTRGARWSVRVCVVPCRLPLTSMMDIGVTTDRHGGRPNGGTTPGRPSTIRRGFPPRARLKGRGLLAPGVADRATYPQPFAYVTGVRAVLVLRVTAL